jgi:hypothetical protein
LEPVVDRATMKRFLTMPWAVNGGDPNWVPPLLFERRQHLDPGKNPYFESAEAAYWLAMRGTACLGRISGQVNRTHLRIHDDGTGHFGFLEAVDDPAVFAALLGAMEDWLRARGLRRVVGPFSLSINDESGLLVQGFQSRPFIMMGHGPPYYGPRLEEQGYRKAKDLIAYAYDLSEELPPAAAAFVKKLEGDARVSIRPLDMSRYDADLDVIAEIFNDAWAENWGFLPLSKSDARHMAKNLKPLVAPEHVAIASVAGEPAAMAVTLPNVNEAIADLDGRLLPFGWAKLLWRLKVRTPKSARLPLMGVRRKYQESPLGAALALGVVEAVRRHHRDLGTRHGELSWVLEDNRRIRHLLDLLGAKPYKTYRLYEKDLT